MIIDAIIYFIIWMLGVQVWDSFKNRGEIARIVTGIRGRDALLGLVSVALLLLSQFCMLYLATLEPRLQWSWLSLLNVHEGTALSAGVSAQHTVPMTFIIGMYVLLVLAMPMLALAEEKMFRRNTEKRSLLAVVLFSVLFGLAHLVIGFPIFAAFGLTTAGLFYSWVYLQAWNKTLDQELAIFAATRVHLMSNLMAILLFASLWFLIRP